MTAPAVNRPLPSLSDLDDLILIAHWSGVSRRALLLAYIGLEPLSERDCDRLRALRDQLT